MTWDSLYRTNQQVWGDKPSELATFACNYLQGIKPPSKAIDILDLGCGYGRDAMYLARNIKCQVFGIDDSSEAIEMAQKSLADDLKLCVKFQCGDFRQMNNGKFDIVFTSNVYHLLKSDDRNAFRNTIDKNVKPGGMLFFSTLSLSDPEHFGKGKRIENEDNSFEDKVFIHFCTREEMERDFSFLTIKELFEYEFYESRSNGEIHHHILWMFMGVKRQDL